MDHKRGSVPSMLVDTSMSLPRCGDFVRQLALLSRGKLERAGTISYTTESHRCRISLRMIQQYFARFEIARDSAMTDRP